MRNPVLGHRQSAFTSSFRAQISCPRFTFPWSAPEPICVPAFTACFDPDPDGARVRVPWHFELEGPIDQVLWFGELKAAGKLDCALSLRLAADVASRLQLTVAGQSHEAVAKGDSNGSVTVRFGSFDIPSAGYQRFTLSSLNGLVIPTVIWTL
ncbi:MAG: hypothetical protein U1G07_25565 [Verrucomicrobiota bacterium]